MTHLALIAMMQLVISTKAGLVNHVQGVTNVSRLTQVPEGAPIRTALNGYAEVLLTPGAFLRLDENSEMVLDSVEIADVAVRVVRGAAVVEAIEVNKDYPIRVTTGNLTMKIFQKGIFRFEDGKATVIDGKLRTADLKSSYSKGWQISFDQAYHAQKLGLLKPTGLDLYSQTRSEQIARANAAMLTTARGVRSSWEYDYWLFAPGFGYTFLPRGNYTSPYGYRYYGVGYPTYNGGGRNDGNNGGFGGLSASGNGGGGNTGNSGNPGVVAPSSGGGGGVVLSTPAAPPPTTAPASTPGQVGASVPQSRQ